MRNCMATMRFRPVRGRTRAARIARFLEVPDPMSGPAPDLIVTAPNGIAWKRLPGGTCSGPEFLAALAIFTDTGGRIAREWNWWQDGRQAKEDERIREVVRQWDHAEPPPGGYLTAGQLQAKLDANQAERQSQRQARAARYDKDLAM